MSKPLRSSNRRMWAASTVVDVIVWCRSINLGGRVIQSFSFLVSTRMLAFTGGIYGLIIALVVHS